MKREKTESFLNKSIPILGGLFIGGVVILIVKSPYAISNGFWTYNLIAGVFLVGVALTVWLMPLSIRIEKKDLEVWQKYEKRTWSRFVLQETFGQPILFLVALGIGGLLIFRDYRNELSPIDRIALYLMPALMILVGSFLSATKHWKRMQKAMEIEKFKI